MGGWLRVYSMNVDEWVGIQPGIVLGLNMEKERIQDSMIWHFMLWIIFTSHPPEVKYRHSIKAGCCFLLPQPWQPWLVPPLPHPNLSKLHKSFTLTLVIIFNIHPMSPPKLSSAANAALLYLLPMDSTVPSLFQYTPLRNTSLIYLYSI